jgi:hypothetical protein
MEDVCYKKYRRLQHHTLCAPPPMPTRDRQLEEYKAKLLIYQTKLDSLRLYTELFYAKYEEDIFVIEEERLLQAIAHYTKLIDNYTNGHAGASSSSNRADCPSSTSTQAEESEESEGSS